MNGQHVLTLARALRAALRDSGVLASESGKHGRCHQDYLQAVELIADEAAADGGLYSGRPVTQRDAFDYHGFTVQPIDDGGWGVSTRDFAARCDTAMGMQAAIDAHLQVTAGGWTYA